MIILARKKTSTEAGWIVFAVIFSTFSSALIIFLCWWNIRGSSKKSSEQQQQSGESPSRTRSTRSVRYWYYYPEYFGGGHNGSSESPPSEDYTSYTGTGYHLEQQQTPNYYIYPPPPYPPCPDPPPPPPRPPRTPPHIAVYRTRPVNVMSFLDRMQRPRKPPPPVAEFTSPEPESTPPAGDGSSSSPSGSSPDEPPPDGPPPDGPKGDDPSGGPRPDGSGPGSTDPIVIDVHSPKEENSEISRQDVSEAQANFSKLMSVADTASERSVLSQANSEQSTSVNLSHRSMSKASKASMREPVVDGPTREPSPRPSSHVQRSAAGSELGSHRPNSARPTSGVRYVKAPTTKGSSKERRSSGVASPHGDVASSPSTSSSTIRSVSPPPTNHIPNRNSQPSHHSSIRSRHSRPSPMPRLSPSPPRSHTSHHSLPASRSRHSSPPQSPKPPHHSSIPRSPSRHTHSRFDDRPPSRQSSRSAASRVFSPLKSPTPPHHSPIPYSPGRHSRRHSYTHSQSQSYGQGHDRPTSRHPSTISRSRSRVSSMPPSPTVTDFASSVSGVSSHHRHCSGPDSPRSARSSVSPAYKSGGFRTTAALSLQQEDHQERKGSRQSMSSRHSRYSRHLGEKSPSVVSVSVVELLSLEKDLDQDGHGQREGEPMSLLEHEEHEREEEHGPRQGSETAVNDEDQQRQNRRSVSSNSQRRRSDQSDNKKTSVENEHLQDRHDDAPDDSNPLSLQTQPEHSHSHPHPPAAPVAVSTEPLPPSSIISSHSSNLSPKTKSSPYHPGKYIPVSMQAPLPKENRPHQASVCSVSDRSTDSGVGGVGERKGE